MSAAVRADRGFSCPFCKYTCRSLWRLKTHVRKDHTRSCPVCGWTGKKLATHAWKYSDLEHFLFAFLITPHWNLNNRIPPKALDRVVSMCARAGCTA